MNLSAKAEQRQAAQEAAAAAIEATRTALAAVQEEVEAEAQGQEGDGQEADGQEGSPYPTSGARMQDAGSEVMGQAPAAVAAPDSPDTPRATPVAGTPVPRRVSFAPRHPQKSPFAMSLAPVAAEQPADDAATYQQPSRSPDAGNLGGQHVQPAPEAISSGVGFSLPPSASREVSKGCAHTAHVA